MKKVLLFALFILSADLLSAQTNIPATPKPAEPRTAEQDILALEQTWATAVQHQDTAKIDQIQADEYLFTGPTGQIWTKSRELDNLKSGALVITAFELSEQRVRLYDNTAGVTLKVNWTGTYNGEDISGPQRMTDVFVKHDGHWQCVVSQTTRITN